MLSLRQLALCTAFALTAGVAAWGAAPRVALAQQVRVEAGLDHRVLAADGKRRAFLRVGLTGAQQAPGARRARMNVGRG